VTTINVALVGYAFMGRAHSNAYRQVSPFFSPRLRPRMKVLCGRTQDKVLSAAKEYGWEEAATDWESVVSRKDIDIVDISTPGDMHLPIAIAAARAGKVVFCEKPLANSLREATKMHAAVKKAGVINMVCHNYRRAPAVMLAKHLIDADQLGDIRHFRGTYLQDWIVDANFPMGWRFDKRRAGSGALGDIASHSIDLARFLVGEIAEVSAGMETFIKQRPIPGNLRRKAAVTVDDAVAAVVRFTNGALGTIEATRLAPGRKNYNRFEINGSKGSIAFDLERMNELEVYLDSDPEATRGFRRVLVTESSHPFIKAWWPPGHIIGYEHTFTHTVFDLLEAIADDKMPKPDFTDGLNNQRVLHAIETASAKRKWVTV
jgi:predicted dehydrogenase